MYLNNIVLSGLIVLAVYFDATQKRIPNIITLPVMLWGFISYIVFEGFYGFSFSGIGFLAGLGIFIVPYILGGMGGGDVKFMAAIGALKGAEFVLYTALFASAIGGLMIIVHLVKEKNFIKSARRVLGMIATAFFYFLGLLLKNPLLQRSFVHTSPVPDKNTASYIPYGIAIGTGAFAVLGAFYFEFLPLALIVSGAK